VTADVIHARLEDAARARPDHPAVVDRGRSLTYGELDRRANQLAHVLSAAGVGRGERVAVLLTKSADAVCSLYAVMKTGAAYVPLDPGAPPQRLSDVVADCRPRCVLTDRPDVPGRVDPTADPLGVPDDPIECRVTPDDLAYILYTSGSTGVPKGVMLTHANATAFVQWAGLEFGVTADDRLASHAPLHFDLSVFDLYASAAAAATVVLVPPEASVLPMELRRFLERERITVSYSVPSVLTQLARRAQLAPGDLPALRTVLFAGEVFPTKYLRRLMAALPHARFANLYGPTETNVCTWYDVTAPPASDDETVPIGVAVPGTSLAVLGDDDGTATSGCHGELLVQGPSVARGYWRDPQRTSSRFVTSPRPDLPGRWYRTGDLVDAGSDGNLRFVGRRDSQVKSRGYRIELGDVEAAIHAHPAVVECAVVAVPDELVSARLHAFAVVDADVSVRDLARFTAERVPRPMVPESFEICAALPRTATGKTDRRALVDALHPGAPS
jgi:amino acid adenylation domain-containing protein